MTAGTIEFPSLENIPSPAALQLPPSDTIRAYYDPTDRLADTPDRAFIESVIANRSEGVARGIGRLAANEVIIVDATQATLTDITRYCDYLGLPEGRAEGLITKTERHADIIAGHIVAEVDQHIEAMVQKPFFKEVDRPMLPSRLLMAGKLLGAVAHQGKYRRSGDEYASHPDAVAVIIAVAYRSLFGMSGEAELDTHRFIAMVHDAPEETFKPDSSHLFEERIIISPLLAKRVVERLGCLYGSEVAKTLLLMSNMKDASGNQLLYHSEYIVRGVREQPRFYIPVKLADNGHNKLDPKPGCNNDKKAAKYGLSQTYLTAQALRRTDPLEGMLAVAIGNVTNQDIVDRQRRRFDFIPNDGAVRVHQAVDRDLGTFALAA